MTATYEIHEITDRILKQMAELVYTEKLSSSEAAEQVFKALSTEDKLDFFEINGKTAIVQYFNQHRGSERHRYLQAGVITKQSNTNGKREVVGVDSPYDITYRDANGFLKRLGDFTIKDLQYQVAYYNHMVKANTTELNRLSRLLDGMVERVSDEDEQIVRDVYKAAELDKVLRG